MQGNPFAKDGDAAGGARWQDERGGGATARSAGNQEHEEEEGGGRKKREKGCLAHIFSMYILQGDGFHICECRLYLRHGFTRSSSDAWIYQFFISRSHSTAKFFLVLVN